VGWASGQPRVGVERLPELRRGLQAPGLLDQFGELIRVDALQVDQDRAVPDAMNSTAAAFRPPQTPLPSSSWQG
jgi:hypothetical protein